MKKLFLIVTACFSLGSCVKKSEVVPEPDPAAVIDGDYAITSATNSLGDTLTAQRGEVEGVLSIRRINTKTAFMILHVASNSQGYIDEFHIMDDIYPVALPGSDDSSFRIYSQPDLKTVIGAGNKRQVSFVTEGIYIKANRR